ncbi:dihydromonapterin reductase [Shewanella gelidimarina]|uniref:dihydromonapterin reductase n=1 Tax=Shewanella gelidimarina TaxID=56813 RepID=UPI0020101166|nr:dihydromonapterin reductase [Shewanella gelidimarina]MCL1059403.1 dihydromonapterin reductase [Shewanella gelidimarina]
MTAPILITGVGKRVGFYLAKHLAQQGQKVIGTYRSQYPQLQELETLGVELYRCDFEDASQLDELLVTLKQQPAIRAIIHNASDWLPDGDADSAIFIMDKMMRIHVSVPYVINLALTEQLNAYTGGTADIIHITDYVAEKGSKKHAAYAASKAALHNLTLSFAAKLAPNVKVNSIAPAMLMFNPDDGEQYKQKALKKSLLQKEGGESEVLNAVTYLMQSQYVTGQVIKIDGGRHLV